MVFVSAGECYFVNLGGMKRAGYAVISVVNSIAIPQAILLRSKSKSYSNPVREKINYRLREANIDVDKIAEKPKVSILINNYNYGHFLDDAVSSALNQTYPNVEVVVVDDGSTDNSADILAIYQNSAKIIMKSNGGQASAFNAGFANCTGEIICFLDADDSYSKDKVSEIVRAFAERSEAMWCFDKVVSCNERMIPITNENRTGKKHYSDHRSNMRAGVLGKYLAMPIPATSGLAFRHSVLDRIFPIAESESCSMCENYMKYVSIGISPGILMDTSLTNQRLHGKNLFTQNRSASMTARISIMTGYWLAKNFPELSAFADTQMAFGLAAMKKGPQLEEKYHHLIAEHFSKSGFARSIGINLRSFYYVFFNKLQLEAA